LDGFQAIVNWENIWTTNPACQKLHATKTSNTTSLKKELKNWTWVLVTDHISGQLVYSELQWFPKWLPRSVSLHSLPFIWVT